MEFHVLLGEWETFYLLMGTAGATLAGLLFVTITFSAAAMERSAMPIMRAHTDPALVAFALNLGLSVLLLMPVLTRGWCAAALIAAGLTKLGYMGTVLRLLVGRRLVRGWDAPDWCWYAAVPVLCSLLLVVSGALCLTARAGLGVTLTGVTLLLLLAMGLRNAWDMVTFTILRQADSPGPDRTGEAAGETQTGSA